MSKKANKSKTVEAARQLHARLAEILTELHSAEVRAAFVLHEMKVRGLHRSLGYSQIGDYAWAEHRIAASKANDLIAVVTKSEPLNQIRRAFEGGTLEWTKARTILRVAKPRTQAFWIKEAGRLSSRSLEAAVAHAKGAPLMKRRVVDLTPTDAADLDRAIERLREQRGRAISVGEAIAELARRAMAAPSGRPDQRIVQPDCATCGAASRDGRDEPAAVPDHAAEKGEAEIVASRDPRTVPDSQNRTPKDRKPVVTRHPHRVEERSASRAPRLAAEARGRTAPPVPASQGPPKRAGGRSRAKMPATP